MFPLLLKGMCLKAAAAEGGSLLNAFDNALLKIGIGNCNLIKLSSVVPENIRLVGEVPDFKIGSLVPVVYVSMESDKKGEVVTAALGVGFRENNQGGLIYEYAGNLPREEAENVVKSMVREGFERRGWKMDRVEIVCESKIVNKPTSVVACAIMWGELNG